MSWKIRPLGPRLYMRKSGRSDTRRDMTKVIRAFRDFAEVPNIRVCLSGLGCCPSWFCNSTQI